MVKIKNVRPGILIIADAGLKLAPGESVELEKLTRQAQKAVDDGLLACNGNTSAAKAEAKPETRAESKPAAAAESKPKGKTNAQASESKETSKKHKSQPAGAEEEQPPATEENPDAKPDDSKPEDKSKESSQGQLLGTGDAPK